MTDEAMKKLTLGDLERIAARFSKAVTEIREGQRMLNPGTSYVVPGDEATERLVIPAEAEDPAAAHRRRQFQPPEQPNGHPVLSAAEVNQRNALLGRQRAPVDPNLPDDIRHAMESE